MAIPYSALKDLVKLPVAAEWRRLGLQLGVSLHKLKEIQANHQHSVQDCLVDMFDWWLNNDDDTTYERLARGIGDIGEIESVTCFLQQRSQCDEVYSKLAHALNRVGEGDLAGTHNRRWSKKSISILLLAAVLTAVAIALLFPPLTSTPCSSKSLPYLMKTEAFVGRQAEIQNITRWIENIPIVSIVGPPGFGKSTLAIHVGHAVCSQGTTVHYINLQELSCIDNLKHELLTVQFQDQKQATDPVLAWAKELEVETLLILDNCDHLLNKSQNEFQTLLKNMVKHSPYLKVLLTAKHVVSFLHSFFRKLTLTELTPEYATELLMITSELSNRTMAASIAKLVGNAPLALQVVGKLLKERDMESVIKQLQTDPILTLSPKDLPSEDRVVTSLNISYGFLTPENQKCARLLANFPGSFDETAALAILNHMDIAGSECLSTLRYWSLLSIDGNTGRYRLYQFVKKFFTLPSLASQRFTVDQAQFFRHFAVYYAVLYFKIAKPPVKASYDLTDFQVLDAERKNIEYVFTLQSFSRKHSNVFDRFSDAFKAHVQRVISLANHLMKKRLKYLQKPDLEDYRQLIKNTLMDYDMLFPFLSGRSASFTVYVNLLILLSKTDGKVDGQSQQLRTLLSRSNRVKKLYHLARTDNSTSSCIVYSKYHSALAKRYIQYGESFEHFLEHWKEILQLKWSLTKCKQVGCTPTHLALAHFGQGNYKHSAKLLKTLLQSKSLDLQGNRRVRLFILLHESYMRLGEVEKAWQLLTKDHLLSEFPLIRMINATNHGNLTSMSVLYNDDHSAVMLLDQECMTISSENYKTCKILAAFYGSLGSRMQQYWREF